MVQRVNSDRFVIKGHQGNMVLQVITDSIVRVCYTKGTDLPDPSLIFVWNKAVTASIEIQELAEVTVLQTATVKIYINKKNGNIEYFSRDGRLYRTDHADAFSLEEKDIYRTVYGDNHCVHIRHTVDGLRMDAEEGQTVWDRKGFGGKLSFSFDKGEAVYGLGSHEGETLNLRGHTEHLYPQNFKACVPMLVSSRGYGLLFDCMSYMKFQDEEESCMFFDVLENDCLDFYILFGPKLDEVVAGYRYLTGQAPMLPKWTFGYWQSKERYKTQAELLEITEEFRKRQIPMDAIVLDWKSWTGDYWGQKTMDPERFPDPKALTADLHRQHVHMVISIWPNMYTGGENHAEMLKNGYLLGNLSTYDAFNGKARAMYWRHAKEGLFDQGIDAWWCDCTEPFETDWKGETRMEGEACAAAVLAEFKKYIDPALINAYSLYHSKGIYDGQRAVTSKKRVVNLTRSAYAGQHRYATITWSGDVSATWDVLYRQMAAGLNFTVTGNPYWTFDVGGFFVKSKPEQWFWKGEYPDGCEDLGYRELYTRWMQMGVFMPILRSHGTDTPREPWRFGAPGEPFFDSVVKAIHLRYELMPYTYSLAAAVTFDNGTMLRLLAFDHEDEKVLDIRDQFMFGSALMVCPVTRPMYYETGSKPLSGIAKERSVYLPAGKRWYDFHTDMVYEGGQCIQAAAPLDTIPVFVPEGSIIPRCEVAMSTEEQNDTNLKLKIYPGRDARFVLYFDEGDSYAYENGACCTVELLWDDAGRTLTVGARSGSYPGMAEQLAFEVELAGEAGKHTVLYNGTAIKEPVSEDVNTGPADRFCLA